MQETLTESNVFEYLRGIGALAPGEDAVCERAGEGNINWVRRIRIGDRSLVVKQARPVLERFPEYGAPTERIVYEARYYADVSPFDRDSVCPEILHFDEEQRVLLLEDLGAAQRLDDRLASGGDSQPALLLLVAFLGRVHAGTRGGTLPARYPNGEMQRLHGDHIFALPYRPNDFPLSPAVRSRAESLWNEAELVSIIDAAYARYLEPVGALVHADVQPTNLLVLGGRPKLLDAEIAHVGDPAFDLGSLFAHLILRHLVTGDRAGAAAQVAPLWDAYIDAHGPEGLAAFRDVARYAGIELLRRTLGAARVPEVTEDAAGTAAVRAGVDLVMAPPTSPKALAA